MLAKLTRGNQITIPKDIVLKAHLKQGQDYLDVQYSHGVIHLKPVDVEERIPPEVYEKLIQRAVKKEPGDQRFSSMAEMIADLKKRAKK